MQFASSYLRSLAKRVDKIEDFKFPAFLFDFSWHEILHVLYLFQIKLIIGWNFLWSSFNIVLANVVILLRLFIIFIWFVITICKCTKSCIRNCKDFSHYWTTLDGAQDWDVTICPVSASNHFHFTVQLP